MISVLKKAELLRQRAGAIFVDGFFRSVSSAGRMHPRARPERHNVEVIRDIPYVPGSELAEHRLDIYRPTANPGPHPVVLYVHGGGFRILSKESHWLMGLLFARRGFLVFNISYRLAPKHRYPSAVEDTFTAFEWVLDHAAEYGGDLSRLVLAGESAGANLVTTLALSTCYRRTEPHAERIFARNVVPSAVVPACGIFQVSDTERFARSGGVNFFIADRLREVSSAYLGTEPPSDAAHWDLADPLLVFERGEKPDRPLPPFFLPCGTRDPLVDDSRRMKRALDKLGVECAAPEYEGEHHAFHAFIFKNNARKCWRDTFDFLCPKVGLPNNPIET